MRVHFVKKAQKDYPQHGILKGESYYWWQHAFRPREVSKESPKRQQLTQSDFMRQVYDLEDRINALSSSVSLEDIQSERDSIAEDIRSLGEEQREKQQNMPEQLQETGSGELLGGRADSCEEWADELEAVDIPDEDSVREEYGEGDTEKSAEDAEAEIKEAMDEKIQEVIDEIQACSYNGE